MCPSVWWHRGWGGGTLGKEGPMCAGINRFIYCLWQVHELGATTEFRGVSMTPFMNFPDDCLYQFHDSFLLCYRHRWASTCYLYLQQNIPEKLDNKSLKQESHYFESILTGLASNQSSDTSSPREVIDSMNHVKFCAHIWSTGKLQTDKTRSFNPVKYKVSH